MTNFTIHATVRNDEGKGASRRLRTQGAVPGIVYGGKVKPISIAIEHNKIWNQLLADEAIYTSLVDLDIDGKVQQVIIKDIQRHPYANKLVHIDFQRIEKSRHIVKRVPLSFVDAEKSPGVRLGALLTPLVSTVEVRCLPDKLPQCIEIDCSVLEAGDSMKMSQVKLPDGVELTALRKGGSEYDHSVLMLGKAR